MNSPKIKKIRKAEQLTNAFQIFNELSQNLSISYQGLEEQIAKLHRELAFAHSERLKTLEEKEKLANRLEKIQAALPAGVLVLDANSRVVNCNALAIQFLGHPLIDKPWPEVMPRCLIPVSHNPHEYELLNGKRVNVTSSQVENDGGQIILISDVSEMRTLQDMLHQQKQLSAMGEMVASMAHQVRTPLATAILYASQLCHRSLEDEKRQKFSQKILERLLHLERQVNDMLIFAKDGRMAMERFSIRKFLFLLEDGFREYAGQRCIDLKISNHAPSDEMVGNENALSGALMNLLNNAVDAVGEIGCIRLSVSQHDHKMWFAVSDNGAGMSEEQRQRVFEPFYTTKSYGTGLGLAVVDSVTRAHGGYINIETALGQGTVFTLALPAENQISSLLPGGFSGKNLNQSELWHESV